MQLNLELAERISKAAREKLVKKKSGKEFFADNQNISVDGFDIWRKQ